MYICLYFPSDQCSTLVTPSRTTPPKSICPFWSLNKHRGYNVSQWYIMVVIRRQKKQLNVSLRSALMNTTQITLSNTAHVLGTFITTQSSYVYCLVPITCLLTQMKKHRTSQLAWMNRNVRVAMTRLLFGLEMKWTLLLISNESRDILFPLESPLNCGNLFRWLFPLLCICNCVYECSH